MPERIVRPYVLVLAALFSVAFLAGFFAPISARQPAAEIFKYSTKFFSDLSGGALFLVILLNNTFASLLILLTGLIVGILPII